MNFNPKAPPVYKPGPQRLAASPVFRANQACAQLKPAVPLMLETRPPPPPAYKPQARATRPKQLNSFRSGDRPAPPVYRPNAAVQQKSQVGQRLEKRPAPAVYRPGTSGSPVAQTSKAALFPAPPANAVIKQKSTPVSSAIRKSAPFYVKRSFVLQRMEAASQETPEVEMTSQFLAEGLPVDLNCGRYCVDAAIRWWGKKFQLNLKPDIFHELPEPTPKDVGFWGISLGSLKASWSPADEGRDFTHSIEKPNSLPNWKEAIEHYGPLTVSGDLGDALITWVGHYILIVGVDLATQELICKDPLKSTATVRHKFSWIQGRITAVYAVRAKKLNDLLQE